MVRVALEPITTGAGGPRVFNTLGFDYNKERQQLTLWCRDGRICVELVGSWHLTCEETRTVAHSIDEAERIHDGRSLVLMN